MKKNWYKNALGRFKIIALCEGVSFLLLLFIAMPLKYLGNIPQAVEIAGWLHGLLFISYLFTLIDVKMSLKWSMKKTIIAFVAAIIPFGPFILEKRVLQNERMPE